MQLSMQFHYIALGIGLTAISYCVLRGTMAECKQLHSAHHLVEKCKNATFEMRVLSLGSWWHFASETTVEVATEAEAEVEALWPHCFSCLLGCIFVHYNNSMQLAREIADNSFELLIGMQRKLKIYSTRCSLRPASKYEPAKPIHSF